MSEARNNFVKQLPLILFAKAPIPGKVKTRLHTHCSHDEAAQVAKILLEASIQKATEYWPGTVYLSVWLDQEHSFIQSMLQRYPITLASQCEGNLGVKMRHALQTLGYPAAILGCDAPHVLGEDLKLTYATLCRSKPVIGPSIDGGYYLIGLEQDRPEVFSNIRWGQDSVFKDTLSNAEFSFTQLHALNDVDEWSDLIEAAKQLPHLQRFVDQKERKNLSFNTSNRP